jgi:hypothetical protein
LFTRSTVSSEEGAVVGIAVKTAASPLESTVAGVTDCTPAVFPMSFSSVVSRVSVADDAGEPKLALISSGPLVPTPKPLAIRS